MNRIKDQAKIFSPSRTVWRTQMAKGLYTPHRVSRITCIVNQLLSEPIIEFLKKLDVVIYDETGRTVREQVITRTFGFPGESSKLINSPAKIFRFTVPRENSKAVIKALIRIANLEIPGRGSVFSQELMEFSKEPEKLNNEVLNAYYKEDDEFSLMNDLSYVMCVLSNQGSGERLAKMALQLGICVPTITFGKGNDIRDQLGLIRITIPAENEIVHLVMPEHDSDSIIKLLVEGGRLDKPGRGYIYQTPVSTGLIDTRMKIGRQKHAASMEQIIAAIDLVNNGTTWRKRLDAENESMKISQSMKPQDNCEISIISDEDRIDILREICLETGASGATTSNVIPLSLKEVSVTTMIRSAISVPAQITDLVVDKLLEVSTIKDSNTDKIQVLDSPAAYVRTY